MCEKVVNKELQVQFVPSKEQVTEIFTNALCSSKFLWLHSEFQPLAGPYCRTA